MASWYLIAGVRIGTRFIAAGSLIDDTITPTADITSAGGLLWPSTDAVVAAAALKAQQAKLMGQDEQTVNRIMRDAVDTVQKTSDDRTLLTDGDNLNTYVDNATTPGVECAFVIAIPDGATGDVDLIPAVKFEVTSIEVVKTGAAGGAADTITVKKTATAITDAMSINVADKIVVRPATIDDAETVFNGTTDTLRVTRTKASAANVACRVIVRGVRRA